MGKFSFWAIITTLAITVFFNSCTKASTKSTTIVPVHDTLPAIGASYGGGILAYVLHPGEFGYDSSTPHGIIVAPTDQSTGISWFNGTYIATSATGRRIGTGIANTNAILASQGAGSYAASICRGLSLGGHTDWYLPSIDELYKLYLNRAVIGGFSENTYWSSTEYSDSIAWGQIMFTGGQAVGLKDIGNNVRAVRSF